MKLQTFQLQVNYTDEQFLQSVVISYGCKNTNAWGIVIVSYHSYLIIDLIRYLSLFTITLYIYFKYFLTFMNWENSDRIEIFSSYFIKT
jgi:hypothetical protein